MSTTECPAFARVLDAIRATAGSIGDGRPFDLTQKMIASVALRAASGSPPWLHFLMDVALKRRRSGVAETPDGFVFTATQVHNYLNSPDAQFGAPCPYADAVFLTLLLTGETKMKHTLESVEHFTSSTLYDEDDDDDDNSDSDSDFEESEPSSEESEPEAEETDEDDARPGKRRRAA